MTMHLIGGRHSDPLETWESKTPEETPDKVAVEAINGLGEINKETFRIILQPISAFVILIHDLLRIISCRLFDRLSNDQRKGQEIASRHNADVLTIDAPPLSKINQISLFSFKTIIDWANILILIYFLLNSIGAVTLLVALNLIFQPILTLYIFRDIRDEYMSDRLLEYTNKTVFVFTGSLHTIGVAGKLLSKGIKPKIHI